MSFLLFRCFSLYFPFLKCIYLFIYLPFSQLFNWVKPAGHQGHTLLHAEIEVRQHSFAPSSQLDIFSFDSLKRGLPLMQPINMDECFIAGGKKDRF